MRVSFDVTICVSRSFAVLEERKRDVANGTHSLTHSLTNSGKDQIKLTDTIDL